jgi:hypothetical protein
MRAATVTIGRNIGHVAMDATEWAAFRSGVADLFAELWTPGAEYAGTWTESDGTVVTEASAVFFGPLRPDLTDGAVRSRLADLATRFEQDAIGLTVGTPDLVTGADRHAPAELQGAAM